MALNTFVVLYWSEDVRQNDDPLSFVCEAESIDHAEEQCENAYPGCDIVWVYMGSSIYDAREEFVKNY